MTLQEIKDAVENGKIVCLESEIYEVRKDNLKQWHIVCTSNDSCIGLTHKDGITLNGLNKQFFVKKDVRKKPSKLK